MEDLWSTTMQETGINSLSKVEVTYTLVKYYFL